MFIKIVAIVFASIAIITVLYLGIAFGLSMFPANKNTQHQTPVVQAYVASNGVHTDFVFPIQSQWIDWRELFPFEDFQSPDFLRSTGVDVIMVGWGDREFYLNTPQWEDLTVSTAVSALSGTNPSLLHVTYYRERSLPEATYRLPLDAAQYQALIAYIKETLQWRDNQVIPVSDFSYGPYDAFYQAQGSFSMFSTCNAWIGDGLQQAGVKVSIWTPFASNVFKHLQPREQ